MTTGAVMLVRSTASEWQSDVSREIIQVLIEGRDIEVEVARAVGIAGVSGIAEVRPIPGRIDAFDRAVAGHWARARRSTGSRLIIVRIAPGAAPTCRNCGNS
jgi:cell division transport system permease protein